MHLKQDQVWCPHCQDWVDYTTKEEEAIVRHLSTGCPVVYQRIIASCQECQERLPAVPDIEVENLKRLRAAIV